VLTASGFSKHERDQIWSVVEKNMFDLYVVLPSLVYIMTFCTSSYNTSSFGWDPQSKNLEMFDPQSRFIIARPDGGASDPVSICEYTIFRFDREEYQNVIYWCI